MISWKDHDAVFLATAREFEHLPLSDAEKNRLLNTAMERLFNATKDLDAGVAYLALRIFADQMLTHFGREKLDRLVVVPN